MTAYDPPVLMPFIVVLLLFRMGYRVPALSFGFSLNGRCICNYKLSDKLNIYMFIFAFVYIFTQMDLICIIAFAIITLFDDEGEKIYLTYT